LSTEIAKGIGKYLGNEADKTEVKVCINGSMRGHTLTMCADEDFCTGFEEGGGKAVNVKGSNLVQLHGDAWRVGCGVSYVLEEDSTDFSNHAKEACLCAATKHPKSIVMAANGGPTVCVNLARFMHLSSRGVFAINGMHSKAGKSGASGSFKTTPESLNKAVASLKSFGPEFFTDKDVVQGDDLFAELRRKQLTLLDWNAQNKQFNAGTYTLQPDQENKGESPGIEDETDVDVYCKTAVKFMLDKLAKTEINVCFTAFNEQFPQFEEKDRQAICFNIAEGDVQQKLDPYFQWQGVYWQLDSQGMPLDQAWSDGLKTNARDEGVELVRAYCNTVPKDYMVFHSPAKAKRWGIKGPNAKSTNFENLLIMRGGEGQKKRMVPCGTFCR